MSQIGKRVTISVQVSEAVAQQLEAKCAEKGITVESALRSSIKDFLDSPWLRLKKAMKEYLKEKQSQSIDFNNI